MRPASPTGPGPPPGPGYDPGPGGGGYGAGAERPDDSAAPGRRHRGEQSVDIDEALYTTRAMRRVRPDPVPLDVQAKILDAAIRAPSGGNTQNWRFLLVDDKDVLTRIGPLYRDSIAQLWETI